MLPVRLFFGGLIKRVVGAFAGFFSWARQNPAWALLLIVSALAGFKIWQVTGQRDKALVQLEDTKRAFAETVSNYRKAAVEFEQKAQANVERVATERKELADAQVAQAQSDTADMRARFDRLRQERRADQGRTSATGMPALPQTAGGTPPADDNPGQPADPEMIAVRVDDLETLVLNSIQGEDIRKLWLANEGVDNSPESEE